MADPQSPATFVASKLTRERDPDLCALYAELLRVRRALPTGEADAAFDEKQRWLRVRRGQWQLLCKLAAAETLVPCADGQLVLATHPAAQRESDGVAVTGARGSTAAMSGVWPGRPFPLGATWDGEGTNFSLFSENAPSRRALPLR